MTTALDLMLESALDVTMILHYASDDAVHTIAKHRLQLVGSDGIFGARPHPRLYGTAPRFLGRFALRDGLIGVEEAVARLTARAADRLGLGDRGRIEPGKRADLVLLDPGPLRRHGHLRAIRAGCRTASSASGSAAPARGRTAPRPGHGAAASCAEPGRQPVANRRRPSPMQASVSVGRASFENGVCHTW